MIDLELYYTKTEKKKLISLTKYDKALQKKLDSIKEKFEFVDKEHAKISRERSNLVDKVIERVQKKCKHDVVGPYECSRDDCSGHHYRCKICGKHKFEHFGGKK